METSALKLFYQPKDRLRLTVDGDKMKYEWSGTHNGENYSAAGELHRVKRRR